MIDSLIFYIHDFTPQWPDKGTLDNAMNLFNNLSNGIMPQGDFWMIKKLLTAIEKSKLVTAPTRIEVLKAVVSIYKIKSNDVILRSLDIIKQIEQMFKGDDSKRNLMRDIGWLNFMTQGDIYLDFMEIRNQKIAENIKKENESETK